MVNPTHWNNSLLQRVIIAFLFGPPIALIFWKQGIALYFFLVALTAASQWELFRMFRVRLRHPQRIIGFLSGLIIISDTYLGSSTHLTAILILTLIAYFIIEIVSDKEQKLKNVSLALFVTIYPALFVTFFIRIDQMPFTVFGAAAEYITLFILLVVWIFDTASYFTGMAIGRHLLLPSISPKKTVEGFAGGIASAVLMALAAAFLTSMGYFLHILTISLLTAVAGLVGDLSESLIKRNIGIKDSSNIIPGHGGVLDRFDSLFFAAPVVYCYMSLFS